MGNAPPISEKKLKELRLKYDKDSEWLWASSLFEVKFADKSCFFLIVGFVFL